MNTNQHRFTAEVWRRGASKRWWWWCVGADKLFLYVWHEYWVAPSALEQEAVGSVLHVSGDCSVRHDIGAFCPESGRLFLKNPDSGRRTVRTRHALVVEWLLLPDGTTPVHDFQGFRFPSRGFVANPVQQERRRIRSHCLQGFDLFYGESIGFDVADPSSQSTPFVRRLMWAGHKYRYKTAHRRQGRGYEKHSAISSHVAYKHCNPLMVLVVAMK